MLCQPRRCFDESKAIQWKMRFASGGSAYEPRQREQLDPVTEQNGTPKLQGNTLTTLLSISEAMSPSV